MGVCATCIFWKRKNETHGTCDVIEHDGVDGAKDNARIRVLSSSEKSTQN